MKGRRLWGIAQNALLFCNGRAVHCPLECFPCGRSPSRHLLSEYLRSQVLSQTDSLDALFHHLLEKHADESDNG